MQGRASIIGAWCTLAAENAWLPVFEHLTVVRLTPPGACRSEIEFTQRVHHVVEFHCSAGIRHEIHRRHQLDCAGVSPDS